MATATKDMKDTSYLYAEMCNRDFLSEMQEAVKPFDTIIPIYVNDDGDWCELPSVNQASRKDAELATKEFYDRCLSDYLCLADTPDWDFFERLLVGEIYQLEEGEFIFSENYALIERESHLLE